MVDRASGRLYKLGGCAPGKLPKRPKGSDCKSDCSAFGGSNPSLATNRYGPRIAGAIPICGKYLGWYPRGPPLSSPECGGPHAGGSVGESNPVITVAGAPAAPL